MAGYGRLVARDQAGRPARQEIHRSNPIDTELERTVLGMRVGSEDGTFPMIIENIPTE